MGAFSELNVTYDETDDEIDTEEFDDEIDSDDEETDRQADTEAAPESKVPAPDKEDVAAKTDAVEDKKAADDKKRREHEESEAKRKAEWDAKQAAKKAADEKVLQELTNMSDDELAAAAAKRTGADAERLTRRNMKQCVTEYIQTMCYEDAAFARLTLHPRKNMIHCFRYINRMAADFAKKEMEDSDEKPMGGGYGTDIPDDMCYKWAEDYFRDPDAKEDKDKNDEFIPKTFNGGGSSSAKTKKKEPKKDEKPKPSAKTVDENQLSLLVA